MEVSGSYAPWLYCVQYRETDFAFVSRLLEQEGIFYYFRHEANRPRPRAVRRLRACLVGAGGERTSATSRGADGPRRRGPSRVGR
jgi:uncharacterized protein involved in type VI secretion and phage assembly